MAQGLASGRLTARQLIDQSLEAISDPTREGSRAFIQTCGDKAIGAADGFDQMRAAGVTLPPYAGIPMGVKDLFDVAGEVTKAGSVVLGNQPAASVDGLAVRRLRASGFVPVGRTHMTEFAYSGLGLNSHYETPASGWDRAARHIPGGSSSGSAVAIGDKLVPMALGTDTGGSCRIPAAFCGTVGYKPTASRIPTTGVFPLSQTLDSVGPLASSVDCCAIVDDLMSGGDGDVDQQGRPSSRIRLGLITDYVMDDVEDYVAERFDASIALLAGAGIDIVPVDFPELVRIAELGRTGALVPAEAWAVHRQMLQHQGDQYDPRVKARIEPGAEVSAADYLDTLSGRAELIGTAQHRLEGLDGFVFPTVAITAPTIDSFASGDVGYYTRMNMMCLRNTTVANFLDGCAISLPLPSDDQPGVGLQVMAQGGQDRELFAVARTLEAILAK